jgi:hypothetical protein
MAVFGMVHEAGHVCCGTLKQFHALAGGRSSSTWPWAQPLWDLGMDVLQWIESSLSLHTLQTCLHHSPPKAKSLGIHSEARNPSPQKWVPALL